MPQLAVFSTALGWCGLVGTDRTVQRLCIGHASADEVRAALKGPDGPSAGADEPQEADWFPELRARLERYAAGLRVDFRDCRIADEPQTRFQRRVLDAVRQIEYGRTITYGELARRAGAPGAARAVGNVMADNRVPIIIPCHRVVAAGGKLGGFSAPTGVGLKRQLLAMEAEAAESC